MNALRQPPPALSARLAALLVLLVQLAGIALPHTDRLLDPHPAIAAAADVGAAGHGAACQACLLAHAPAPPAAPAAPEAPARESALQLAAPRHNYRLLVIPGNPARAPPALPA